MTQYIGLYKNIVDSVIRARAMGDKKGSMENPTTVW